MGEARTLAIDRLGGEEEGQDRGQHAGRRGHQQVPLHQVFAAEEAQADREGAETFVPEEEWRSAEAPMIDGRPLSSCVVRYARRLPPLRRLGSTPAAPDQLTVRVRSLPDFAELL